MDDNNADDTTLPALMMMYQQNAATTTTSSSTGILYAVLGTTGLQYCLECIIKAIYWLLHCCFQSGDVEEEVVQDIMTDYTAAGGTGLLSYWWW